MTEAATEMEGALKGRIALVTGASRGIGRAVARALAKAGAHVVITGRSLDGLESLDDEIQALGSSATLLQLDLRNSDRVDQLGPALFQRWERLDILVGNAGVLGPLSPLGHTTGEGFLSTLDINLTANWRLIRTLDPLLKRSDAGRAVFVTSGAAGGKYAYWGPYAASKGGLEALVKSWAAELINTPVRANLINPGPIRTTMRQKAFPGEDPDTLPTPEDIAPLFAELCAPSCTRQGEIVNFRDWRKVPGKNVADTGRAADADL